jgi:phenylpyruvate tautomerase PptA (4-oxalocrotonate tautomerase family)
MNDNIGGVEIMRVEVHVHGNIPLRGGINLAQIEAALQPWLEYLDVESIDEAKSVHRDEPGIVFDSRRRLLELCWTGDVGRNFRKVVEDSLQALSRYCEQAAEVQLSYYHEDGRDEIGIVFVGPNADAIHEAQRRRMVEDISNILSRHFGQQEVAEVVTLVNELFSRNWIQQKASGDVGLSSEPVPTGKGRKHLH